MKQQIQMSIGALKKLSDIWEVASIISEQVKSVARAVIDCPPNVRFSHGRQNTTAVHSSLEEIGFDETFSVNFEDFVQGDDESWFANLQGQE